MDAYNKPECSDNWSDRLGNLIQNRPEKIQGGIRLYYDDSKLDRPKHVLFQGCDQDQIDKLASIFGFNPSHDYIEFLRVSNGLFMFNNALSIYGIVDNFSRSGVTEELTPISLDSYFMLYKQVFLEETDVIFYAKIGSVVGYNVSFGIELAKGGATSLVISRDKYREFSCFSELFEVVSRILESIVICNDDRENGIAIDLALTALCGRSN